MLVVVVMRFNPPPGWPPPPEGFTPDPGWQPDPSWPPPPAGWQLWVPGESEREAGTGLTPGYIGYGQVPGPAGYNQWQGWGAPAPPAPGTDGMAVAGFVLGLLGVTVITAILGIVFGAVALGRIRRTAQGGKGLAIAGIVIGSCWLALFAFGIVTALVVGSSTPTTPPAPVPTGVGLHFVPGARMHSQAPVG